MRLGPIEFTPKRIFGATPSLILAGGMWIYYCGALVLEFSSRWRYTETAHGESHIWTAGFATLALIILCGVFWSRANFTRGPYVIGCILGAVITGLTGWYLEQKLFHAAWHPEKSKAILILAGNAALLLTGLAATPLVLRVTAEAKPPRKNRQAEQVAAPNRLTRSESSFSDD